MPGVLTLGTSEHLRIIQERDGESRINEIIDLITAIPDLDYIHVVLEPPQAQLESIGLLLRVAQQIADKLPSDNPIIASLPCRTDEAPEAVIARLIACGMDLDYYMITVREPWDNSKADTYQNAYDLLDKYQQIFIKNGALCPDLIMPIPPTSGPKNFGEWYEQFWPHYDDANINIYDRINCPKGMRGWFKDSFEILVGNTNPDSSRTIYCTEAGLYDHRNKDPWFVDDPFALVRCAEHCLSVKRIIGGVPFIKAWGFGPYDRSWFYPTQNGIWISPFYGLWTYGKDAFYSELERQMKIGIYPRKIVPTDEQIKKAKMLEGGGYGLS